MVIAAGKRPVPFRTRKLRLPAPMVLHPPGCGRVGHRRHPHPGWEHADTLPPTTQTDMTQRIRPHGEKGGLPPDSVRPNHIKQQPDKAIYPPLASADCANRYEVRTRTPPYYAALARAQRRIAGVLHFPGIPKIAFWVCRLRPRPCKSARSPTSK